MEKFTNNQLKKLYTNNKVYKAMNKKIKINTNKRLKAMIERTCSIKRVTYRKRNWQSKMKE